MPQFEMNGKHLPEFRTFDLFTQGYIEAAFFTEANPDNEEMEDKGFDDLSLETLVAMIADCKKPQEENCALIDGDECTRGNGEYSQDEQAGHDFWLTRNGHGAGFWDSDWPVNGEALTEACESYRQVDLYVGDDGRVYA